MQDAQRFIDDFNKRWHARDHVPCPHCGGEIDMTNGERIQGHVSYWGEEEPGPLDCPHCGKTVWMTEHVQRSWTAAKTQEEALDE
jgi:ribosomal protein S27AE